LFNIRLITKSTTEQYGPLPDVNKRNDDASQMDGWMDGWMDGQIEFNGTLHTQVYHAGLKVYQ